MPRVSTSFVCSRKPLCLEQNRIKDQTSATQIHVYNTITNQFVDTNTSSWSGRNGRPEGEHSSKEHIDWYLVTERSMHAAQKVSS